MNDKTIAVSAIEIKIGDTKVRITPEQLKQLRDTLNDLFPKEVKFYPSAPVIIQEKWVEPYYAPTFPTWPQITCQAGFVSADSSVPPATTLCMDLR